MSVPHQSCDNCGANWLLKWKCQILCPNCGARLDCSDLFIDYDVVTHIKQSRSLRQLDNNQNPSSQSAKNEP